MKKKRRTSGFGRSYADVLIVVKKPHDKQLVDLDWEIHSQDSETSSFKYTCVNRYEGDDESIVHSLWGDLPDGFDTDQFIIDWDSSVY